MCGVSEVRKFLEFWWRVESIGDVFGSVMGGLGVVG